VYKPSHYCYCKANSLVPVPFGQAYYPALACFTMSMVQLHVQFTNLIRLALRHSDQLAAFALSGSVLGRILTRFTD